MAGLTVQNFVSVAVGIAVLFALIRGFIKAKKEGLGGFYESYQNRIICAGPVVHCSCRGLASQGVVQNMKEYETVQNFSSRSRRRMEKR